MIKREDLWRWLTVEKVWLEAQVNLGTRRWSYNEITAFFDLHIHYKALVPGWYEALPLGR